MIRTIAAISVGIALTFVAAGVAGAQAAGGNTPALGTSGNATTVSSNNRNANADYNTLIGASGAKSTAKDDARPRPKQAPVPATAADFKVGSGLRDIAGTPIGTISQVDPDGVVVDTGSTKIKVPASAFGKDDQGLLLSVTAAKFNALIAQAHAGH